MLNRLSIKSRLVLLLLIVSLIATLVVGYLGWSGGATAVTDTMLYGINAIRRSKVDQIEAYFRNMRYTVEVLSRNDMVVEAMVRFNRAYKHLENQSVPTEWDQGLESYYTNQFFPKLFANLPGQADYLLYRPNNQAGLYLQYHYIAANPYPDVQKMQLDQAEDGSEYSKVHGDYHPRLRDLIRKLGYEDLILVNFETGDVVYSVAKRTDFASNLDSGPYRNSNEAAAVELVRANAERGVAQLVDFELYRGKYGAPAAFWGAPIYNGSHLVGVLLIQISVDEIDRIMTSNRNWLEVGLGRTGEIYLVGPDMFMRSNSRFLLEDPKNYQILLESLGVPESTIQRILSFDTSILLQKVSSFAVAEVLQNETDTTFTTDYRHVPVLVSYQPLMLEGLRWGLIATMDEEEAFTFLYTFQRRFWISLVLILTLLAFLTIGVANFYVQPIYKLLEGIRRVNRGESNVTVKLPAHDEFGELADGFNNMVQGMHQQNTILAQKEQEVERMLNNMLPEVLARRLRQGEDHIIEQVQQVTILFANVVSPTALVAERGAAQIVELLQTVVADLDEAAKQYDIEWFTEVRHRFTGICGFSTPHLDHTRRAGDFALAAMHIIERLNHKYNIHLNLYMGIHTGPLIAGVLGGGKVIYEIWGETALITEQLHRIADTNTILVSQEVYERLQGQYRFRRLPEIQRDGPWGSGRPKAWVLEGSNGNLSSQTNSNAAPAPTMRTS